MTLIQELKRRNVFRVGILYLVSSWILLQFTDVLSSLLPVPAWAGSLVVLLLSLGFFPVVIFAWIYEMTPEGIKRESDIDRSQSVTPNTGRKINTVIIVLLVIAISGLVVDRLIPEAPDASSVAETISAANVLPVDDRSIAVLPFADLSADQDQQYFTDGLSEELLNLLVRVDGLRVASRTSSFAFRGSTLGIPAISQELNVGHVLEGSVRKDGTRIRITAQLIESGSDTHLWSENFDRELTDIFAIQDEIANAIVSALAGKMGMTDERVVKVEAVTENLDAYEMYLTARELFILRDKLPESIRLFNKAIELDPGFARAWEGLAAVEAVAGDWLTGDGIDHNTLAKDAANRALVLDPDLSMPLAVLGLLASRTEGNMLKALDYTGAALKKDPMNTTAWLWQGLRQKQLGLIDESIVSMERCLEIDPGYLNCRQHMADAYLIKGLNERALAINDQALESNFHSMSEAFVRIYVQSGHRNLALLVADINFSLDNAPIVEWIRAIENPDADNSAGYARLKDWERRTTTGLKLSKIPHLLLSFKAYDDLVAGGSDSMWVLWYPESDAFRKTPQFKRIIRDKGILAFWRERGFPPQCRPIGDDDFECGRPPGE
jgi:adenylate cyclase